MKQLNCILLIDDDFVTNYLHKSILNELNISKEIVICQNGKLGLDYIAQANREGKFPELIFVDLKMPVLDGFGFLESYKNFQYHNHYQSIVSILTTSSNPKDVVGVEAFGIAKFTTKPLTKDKVSLLITEYFNQLNNGNSERNELSELG